MAKIAKVQGVLLGATVALGCGGTGNGAGTGAGLGEASFGSQGGTATDGDGTEGTGEGTTPTAGDSTTGGPSMPTPFPDAGSFDTEGPDDPLDPNDPCNSDGDPTTATTLFSLIWIANTPLGNVSKINTETGQELGRYFTSESLNSPSRTAVNQLGAVAVANRGPNGSVVKIAAREQDCVESNGMPGIQTSVGNDPLEWGADECVLWKVDIPSGDYERGPRAVAWEGGDFDAETCTYEIPNPRLWVAWHGAGNTIEVRRLDGATGAVLDQVQVEGGGGKAYGGAVNADGDFWILSRLGLSGLIHIDGETLESTRYDLLNRQFYGLAIDKDGNPWVNTWQSGENGIYMLDVDSGTFIPIHTTGGPRYRGLQIDREGRAWVAGNDPCRISMVDTITQTLVDDNIALPGCSSPVGVSIDSEGFVWVVDEGASTAFKVDPDAHNVVLQADGLSSPYTYSDMTGSGLELVSMPPPA